MVWIIAAVLVVLVLVSNRLFDRRQAAANAPKWIPLASLIAGWVKGNGVQGIYHDRFVTALIDVDNTAAASSSWVYVLTIGTSSQPAGRSWEVDCAGAEPRHFGGDEAAWRRVLAGADLQGLRAAGFSHFSYDARKGELSGTSRLKTLTLESDVRNLVSATKSPPPPTPEVFTAQLDALVRLAEVNQRLDQQT